jgi:hypothetical protein
MLSKQALVVFVLYPNLVLNPKRLPDILFKFLNSLAQKFVSFNLRAGNAESFIKTPPIRFQPSGRLQEPELACFPCEPARANIF